MRAELFHSSTKETDLEKGSSRSLQHNGSLIGLP